MTPKRVVTNAPCGCNGATNTEHQPIFRKLFRR